METREAAAEAILAAFEARTAAFDAAAATLASDLTDTTEALDADTTLWAEAREIEDASLFTEVTLAKDACSLDCFAAFAVERLETRAELAEEIEA